MRKILRLMRAEVANTLDPRRIAARRSKNGTGGRALGIFVWLLLAVAMFAYAFTIAYSGAKAGLPELVILIFFILNAVVTLLTSAFSGSARMLKASNLDVLISMPFTGFQIYCGKLGAYIVENYIYSALFMIPALIAYAWYAAPSPLFIIAAAVIFLTSSLIPIGIGLLISTLFSFATFKVRNKTARNMISAVIFVAIYMLFVSKSGNIMNYVFANGGNVIGAVGRYYPPAEWCLRGALLDWGMLLLFAAVSAAFILAVAYVVSLRFKKSVGAMNASASASRGSDVSSKTSTPFSALLRKETAMYFSTSSYFLNTAIGLIILIFISGYAVFGFSPERVELLESLPFSSAIVLLFIMFVVSISSTTASSVSLEGRRLATLKSMPIRTRDLFGAKITLNVIICVVPCLVSIVMLAAAGLISPLAALLIFIGAALYSVYIAVAGLIVNLNHPKLEWTTEVSVIKQSAAVGIMIGVGLLSTLVCGVLFFLLTFKAGFGAVAVLAAIDGVTAIMAVCSALMLGRKGDRLYNAL